VKKDLHMLAFDFGASSGRAVLGIFDGKQIRFEEVHRFTNEPVWVNGRFYWDILRLWHEVKVGLSKALAQGIAISSIGVDTWGVDYGLLDNKGQLLANPHHYRDQRTVPVMNALVQRYGEDYFYERSGVQFMSFNTVFQLAEDIQNQPELMKLADKALLMPDLFNYLLTGQQATEFSIASTTGLMNVQTRSWDREMLNAIGLAPEKLLPIIPAGTRLGVLTQSFCDELGCRPIPVVAVAGHDTAAAIAAAPLASPEAGFLSSGTWSLLGVENQEPLVTAAARKMNFTNEGGLDHTALLFKNINGLWLLQECRRIWRHQNPDLDYGMISKAARAVKSLGPLININEQRFFAPRDMVAEIQGYCQETGQPIPSSVGEIARCIYDSLAMEYRNVVEKLHQLTGKPLTTMHIVGGGSQDEFLAQLTADALDLPVTAGPVEATAIGNLMIQAIGIGALSGRQEAREVIKRSFTVREYEPEHSDLAQTYQRYLNLIQSNNERGSSNG
jgi:rhamnulokinase